MDFNKIDWIGLPKSQYYQTTHEKTQLVLHHTASGRGADGDINWWLTDPLRIATCMIITHDGRYKQLFSTKYWGHHLGMRNIFNQARNKGSVAFEIDSWGPLVKNGDKYYSYTGTEVSSDDVVYYKEGFKHYPSSSYFRKMDVVGKPVHYYERYTSYQIQSVVEVLQYCGTLYKIPLDYNENMWEYNSDAVEGDPGIWAHVSFRKDKLDCHPQPDLIQALKTL